METDKRIQTIKDAIDKRLKTLYGKTDTEQCNEAKTLEYLMCLIEADSDDEDYASHCLRQMYL